MENENRTEVITIRVTSKEKKMMEENAIQYGISVSNLIRKRILEPTKILLDLEEKKELKILIKIGNEIKRSLNLYHEKRQEYEPYLFRSKNFRKKIGN